MKTTRKKMLLSSIAMLLVALVALGSATYAWFSVSKTVQANGMVVKAISAAGLEISKTSATTGYDTTVTFSETDSNAVGIKPVSWLPSTALTNNGFIPNANIDSPGLAPYNGSGAGTWTDTGIAAGALTATGSNGYFRAYQVWIRSASDGTKRDAHNVSAKVTIGGDTASFARAYLFDGTTANKSFGVADATTAFSCVTSTAGAKTNFTPAASGTSNAVTGTSAVASASATDAGIPYILYVWFDGQDAQCVDSLKDHTASFTIEFTATDM
jgi:hypothetical protein